MLTAVGVHVFAGGFTRGVIDAGWSVPVQLETHGFGLESTIAMNGVEIVNEENAQWPDVDAVMAFGNPRCTAFSTITSGDRYVQGNTHGAFAKQTCDIQQLCEYASKRHDFVIWESVQQAYKASGRELVDHLVRSVFAPRRYRIAHVFINAATFNNAQQRKRYFFVAYKDSYKFNIQPPTIYPYYSTLADVIWDTRHVAGRSAPLWDSVGDYDAECYTQLTEDEWKAVPVLPNGWGLHQLAQFGYEFLPAKFKQVWDLRASDLPFSLHGINRLQWLRPCPTLHSSAGRFIHPSLNRPLTVGELSKIMGWPCIPRGPRPIAQIAKGVCPSVGQWLAEQVELSYRGHWGSDDWESSFNDATGTWDGQDAEGQLEKTFDMTKYVGKQFDVERYDSVAVDCHQRWRALYEQRELSRR